MPERFEAIIYGKVQGVMFRDFVQKKADSLGILGEVLNLEDGTVQVVAEAPRIELEELLRHLYKGPFFAKVTEVHVLWTKPRGEYLDFKITRFDVP